MKHQIMLLSVLLLGCPAEENQPKLDGGFYVEPIDAGPPPIKYTQFTARVNGWPSGAPVRGIALLDTTLYAATDYGLYGLPTSSATWQISGLKVGRPLAAKIFCTAMEFVASAPRP